MALLGELAQHPGGIFDVSCYHVNNLLFPFYIAFQAQQLPLQQGCTKSLQHRRPHHYVDVAGFVFEGNEQHAGGRPGTLPAGYQPGDLDELSMPESLQVGGGVIACQRRVVAQQLHGMWP